jgi:hypothetical protein
MALRSPCSFPRFSDSIKLEKCCHASSAGAVKGMQLSDAHQGSFGFDDEQTMDTIIRLIRESPGALGVRIFPIS